MHCLFFVLFASSVQSILSSRNHPREEENLLRDPFDNGEEGSGEVVLITNSTTSEFSSTTVSIPTKTSDLSTPFPPKPIKCYDISKRCSKIKPLCTRPEYRNIMVRQCAKTCDACREFSDLPPAARCRDSFQSCPIWAKNGFCHSMFYTLDERKGFCRKSCEGC